MMFYDNLAEYIVHERDKLDQLVQANIPQRGVILAVLGPSDDQDKNTNRDAYCVNQPVDQLAIDYLGIAGDRHRRDVFPSRGRDLETYPKGTMIRESRHVFAVCPADCQRLTETLDVEITPELLGANLVIGRSDGEPFSLSQVPTGTRLLIAPPDAEDAPKPPLATLIAYVKQQGCGLTGNAIAKRYDDPTLTKRFMAGSLHHRGVACTVEYPVEAPASLRAGQSVFFRFPRGTSI